jgi:hypothetical protein
MKRDLRTTGIVFGLPLLTSLVLLLVSHQWASFWNVYRYRLSPNQDGVIFVQSVTGYLHVGRYTVSPAVSVPMNLQTIPLQDGHEGFRVTQRIQQYGFLRAMTFHLERQNQSESVVIHYAALAFLFGLFCWGGAAWRSRAGRRK